MTSRWRRNKKTDISDESTYRSNNKIEKRSNTNSSPSTFCKRYSS